MDTAGWESLLCAIGAGFFMGLYPLFIKTKPVLAANVHPVVFQLYVGLQLHDIVHDSPSITCSHMHAAVSIALLSHALADVRPCVCYKSSIAFIAYVRTDLRAICFDHTTHVMCV